MGDQSAVDSSTKRLVVNGRAEFSTPGGYPFILLFTGDTGAQYGYHDAWLPDGTFRYTGEGQEGDMAFVRGNRAIRDHAIEGKDLYLFEKADVRGTVQYLDQMICAGYEMMPGVPDRMGNLRTAIVFYLHPLIHQLSTTAPDSSSELTSGVPDLAAAWTMPMQQLRETALATPVANVPSPDAKRRVYQRSNAVRVYVLRRADGECEGCGTPAPFTTPQGTPYLEPHHVRRLSDGGPDHPDQVIALCPNCHRRVHYGADGQTFNHVLEQKLEVLALAGV